MKDTLLVSGRKMTFNEWSEKHDAEQAVLGEEEAIPAEILVERVEFEVDVLSINWRHIEEKREDLLQENDRNEMLAARAEAESNPEKYGKFKLKLPKKTWLNFMKWAELKKFAKSVAKGEADWVHLYLLFAQFVSNHNGSNEAWETVSNKPSKQSWLWIVTWKDGYGRTVGACADHDNAIPPSRVHKRKYGELSHCYRCVPIFVL